VNETTCAELTLFAAKMSEFRLLTIMISTYKIIAVNKEE